MARRKLHEITVQGSVLLALLAPLALWGCPDKPAPSNKTVAPKGKPAPPKVAPKKTPKKTKGPLLRMNWNPATGRGSVLQVLESGDRLRTAFHMVFPGYTGGLIIGSMNGSGYGLFPREPIHGFKRINVFCAQDESIWDLAQKVEYTYGWSENFGTGKDGKRLEYIRGEVVEQGPRRIVLRSENAGGCYRVRKVAYTRLDVPWWILATRISNQCDRSVRFDFFSGDDPWIGLYRSSDGDVGWTPDGLVRRERVLGPGQFTAGGFYDLGNQALGQKEGSFSNQANFILLDPAVPLPGQTFFANRFAHRPEEIDPKRPLDNKSLTALNLGWRGLKLAPGQDFTVAFAIGLARTGRPGEVPRPAEVTIADWSVWRRYLTREKSKKPVSPSRGVEFAAELVELDLTPTELRVRGTYHLRNLLPGGATIGIVYPILVAPRRPAPDFVLLNGARVPVERSGPGKAWSRLKVKLPDRGLARFVIEYTQKHTGRKAGYMVTSALRWLAPITRAVFRIRHPRSMGRVRPSYRPDHTTELADDRVEMLVVRQPFVPDREMTLAW